MKWFRKHKVITGFLCTFLMIILVLVSIAAGFVWSKLSLIDYQKDSGRPGEHADVQQVTGEAAETESAELQEQPNQEEEQLIDISGLEMVESIPAIPEAQVEKKKDVLNIMVLGTDERGGKLTDSARSDSMILVSINKTDKTVKLVSMERGMGVPVLWGPYEGQYDWMTHMFRYGGAEMVCAVVEECFRVEVDYYVRVNFTTVKTVVDSIGGIDLELTGSEAGYMNACLVGEGRPHLARLQKGTNHVEGYVALMYARLRAIDSDWQRVERQRKVILATVNALKGSSLLELNNLMDQVLPLVQTDMNALEIADLMLYSPNFLQSEFDQMTIPKQGTYGGMTGMGGRGLFAVDFDVNSQILKDFLYGDGTEPTSQPAE